MLLTVMLILSPAFIGFFRVFIEPIQNLTSGHAVVYKWEVLIKNETGNTALGNVLNSMSLLSQEITRNKSWANISEGDKLIGNVELVFEKVHVFPTYYNHTPKRMAVNYQWYKKCFFTRSAIELNQVWGVWALIIYYLSQKFKLLRNYELSHLTIILTLSHVRVQAPP